MLPALLVSVCLGALWHVLVVALILEGSSFSSMVYGLWLGLPAGVAAGLFTIWSKRRWKGPFWTGKAFAGLLSNYYIAVLAYALTMSVFTPHGYPPAETLVVMTGYCLAFGTLYAVVLLPFCWLSREFVWLVHLKTQAPAQRT